MIRKIAVLILCVAAITGFAQVTDYEDLKFPKAKAPKIVKPIKFELKNGLTVLLLEDRDLPVISGEIRFHAGSVLDPKGKEGLADLVGDTMRTGGNTLKSGDEMDDYLESIAASVESYGGATSSGVSFTCLVENVDEVLNLFRATVLHPVFDAEKLEVSRSQMKTSVVRRNDDPKGIASREYSRLVYGLQSPLSAMTELASLDAITRDDLMAYHRECFKPNNAVLAVWGDFDQKAMKKKLTAMFQEWKPGAVPEVDLAIKSEPAGVYFVKREGVTQSNIQVGHLGIRRDNKDLAAVSVFNMLLGGGFDSRMMKIIRRDKGLSYSPHGQISSNWAYPGQFWMSVNTKLGSTGEVLDILKQIITDLKTDGVTQEEMDIAKDGFLNAFAFQFDSLDKIIRRAMAYEFNGYPDDFTEQLFNGVQAVTTKDVQRIAQEYLNLDDLIITVVGDDTQFDKPLSEYGTVTELDVTIPKPKAEPKAAATEQGLKQGTTLMGQAIHRMDPDGKLAGLKGWKMDGKLLVKQGGMEIPMDMVSATRFPDAQVMIMKTPMGDMKTIVTPEKAEMSMGERSGPLPAAQKEAVLNGIGLTMPMLARSLADGTLHANLTGMGEFDGQQAAMVAVTVGEEVVTFAIGEGFVILGTTGQTMDQTGSLVDEKTVWTDWQDFGGLLYPKVRKQTAGANGQTITINTIVMDPEDLDTLFQ